MDKVRLREWKVVEGARVNVGDVVCIVESDKAEMEITTFEAGIVRRLKKEGEAMYSVEDLPFRIETPG